MFRGEKNTQWEGGYRVPPSSAGPGHPARHRQQRIAAHEDMLPTLLAAAGDTTVKEDLLKGRKIGDRTYKVHLDGYDLARRSRANPGWPRKEFIYWTDDGSVAALRYGNWKATFLKQEAQGMHVWLEPFVELRAPMLTNLRMDPFEIAEHENAMGLPALVPGAHVHDRAGGRLRRPMAAEFPRVPAAPEARQLQP
jgi:arylsulfatase A-like enzyme